MAGNRWKGPTAQELQDELHRLNDGDVEISKIEVSDPKRWVRLQILQWNQVISVSYNWFVAAPELPSRLVLHTAVEGDPAFELPLQDADVDDLRARQEFSAYRSFVPAGFAKTGQRKLEARTTWVVKGFADSVSPGKLWASAVENSAQNNGDFFQSCLLMHFRTDAHMNCRAAWHDGEQFHGDPSPEPIPPLGWKRLGLDVQTAEGVQTVEKVPNSQSEPETGDSEGSKQTSVRNPGRRLRGKNKQTRDETIRELHRAGDFTQAQLAKRFTLAESTISEILNPKS